MSGGVSPAPAPTPGEDPAVGDAALANRNPARDELIGGWIDHGFTGAKKKPNQYEQE